MNRKKILVIDDEKHIGEMLKINLEETGRYEVCVETQGSAGLSAAKQFEPDLVLLDIVMPDMEGSYVASQIREDDKLRHVPILFLTATISQDETSSTGGYIGGYRFIAKPISMSELVLELDKHLA